MRVVVASGKGGTGKTLVATNLAWTLASRGGHVAYADADVEAPNGHLFLQPSITTLRRHTVTVPVCNELACTACGLCSEACAFNAIATLQDRVEVFPQLCHSCGACVRACPSDALSESRRETGTLRSGQAGALEFRDGWLDVGEVRATPLVHAVAEQPDPGQLIVDSPPGTSCSALAAVEGADLVLLVCEPTPFGFHDLTLAVEMCRKLGLAVAALINRSDLGDEHVRDYLRSEQIETLAELPFDRNIAAACSNGLLAAQYVPRFAEIIGEAADFVAQTSPCVST